MAVQTPVLLVVEDELPLLQAIVMEAGKVGLQVVSTRSVPEVLLLKFGESRANRKLLFPPCQPADILLY